MQKLKERNILMDKLKILHVISYNGKGGAETLVNNLINFQLKSDKVEYVHVLTFSNVYEKLIFSVESNKNFHHYHIYIKNNFFLNRYFKLLIFIFKVLFQNSYNIINTHLLAPLYTFFLPFLFNNINYTHTVHSQAEKELGNHKYSVHYFLRYHFYKRINLIAISDSVQQSINLFYNLKSQLIFNGAFFQEKSTEKIENFSKKNKKILLAVGHTRKVKNYELLLSAFNKFNNDIILIILGSLVDDFKDYNIISAKNKNIYFLGAVTNVQDYMKIADFLCMTSKYEGMPITILEAKANGLIPIVTPVKGISDLISKNINGIISKDLSIESYQIAIQNALDLSIEEKVTFINNAKSEFNEFYNISKCSENYINYYCLINEK
jgi:glycosyltransferase involved in cell wall biosynthesis